MQNSTHQYYHKAETIYENHMVSSGVLQLHLGRWAVS